MSNIFSHFRFQILQSASKGSMSVNEVRQKTPNGPLLPAVPKLQLCMILGKDERITTWHLCICVTLLMFWQTQGEQREIQASRRKLMQFARTRSIVTYHKCINELMLFGYISYQPSYNPFQGSIFSLLVH